MSLQEKEQVVSGLQERFNASGVSFLVRYSGCSCQDLTGLRKNLLPSGAVFAVVKNTLARRAVVDTPAAELVDLFKGPVAVVWADQDPVAPAKVISEFAKANDSFEIKAGVVDGKVVEVSDIEALASLPSREELFAKLLALINAPAVQLVQMFNAPAGQLVRLLGAWKSEIESRENKS